MTRHIDPEARAHAAALLKVLATAGSIDAIQHARMDLILAGQTGADPQLAFASDPFLGVKPCPVEDPANGYGPADLGCPTTRRPDGVLEHVDGHRDVRLVVRIAHATRTAKAALTGRHGGAVRPTDRRSAS